MKRRRREGGECAIWIDEAHVTTARCCTAEPPCRVGDSASGAVAPLPATVVWPSTREPCLPWAAEEGGGALVKDVVKLDVGIKQGRPKRRKVEAVQNEVLEGVLQLSFAYQDSASQASPQQQHSDKGAIRPRLLHPPSAPVFSRTTNCINQGMVHNPTFTRS